ncbi:hypothetical protein, partial [Desulfacinum hydrothermale]
MTAETLLVDARYRASAGIKEPFKKEQAAPLGSLCPDRSLIYIDDALSYGLYNLKKVMGSAHQG